LGVILRRLDHLGAARDRIGLVDVAFVKGATFAAGVESVSSDIEVSAHGRKSAPFERTR
jgi:hypothetical protein